jgi:large subunit ribosomal protein L21
MKYAVISTGSKQYKVSEGDIIEIDRLAVKPQDSYTFPEVLLYVDGDKKLIGTPVVSTVTVTGEIIENKKGKKIRVAKFKAKARYRKVIGFRSSLTKVKIGTISETK